MAIRIAVHANGSGTCSLTGKEETDGLNVAFEDEKPCFLSKKAFWQLLTMRLVQARQGEPKPQPRPVAPPVPAAPANGPVVAK